MSSAKLQRIMVKITSTSPHHPLHHRRRVLRLPLAPQRLLAALEGVEGGFAIGASIIVALAIAGLNKELLIMTAVISIIVTGFNSASVKYSSEHYLDELDGREKRNPFKHYLVPAAIEFICYVGFSLVVVLPVVLLQSTQTAVLVSTASTLGVLFAAGVWRGYVLHMNGMRDGLETMLLGAGIITIGAISGLIVSSL
jgi:hypothetical protein